MFRLDGCCRFSVRGVPTLIQSRLQVHISFNPHSSAGLRLSPFPYFKNKKTWLRNSSHPPRDDRSTSDKPHQCGQLAFSICNHRIIQRTQPRGWLPGDIQSFMDCVVGSQTCVTIFYYLGLSMEFSLLSLDAGGWVAPHAMEGAIQSIADGLGATETESLPSKVLQSRGSRKDKFGKRYKMRWNTTRAHRRA